MRQITVSATRTYNLGDYENYKPSVTIVEDIPDSEPYMDAYERISDDLTEMLKRERAKVDRTSSQKQPTEKPKKKTPKPARSLTTSKVPTVDVALSL